MIKVTPEVIDIVINWYDSSFPENHRISAGITPITFSGNKITALINVGDKVTNIEYFWTNADEYIIKMSYENNLILTQ